MRREDAVEVVTESLQIRVVTDVRVEHIGGAVDRSVGQQNVLGRPPPGVAADLHMSFPALGGRGHKPLVQEADLVPGCDCEGWVRGVVHREQVA